MADGTLLWVGGIMEGGHPRSVVFDPVTNTWASVGDPLYQHGTFPSALRLSDGRVLVAGGDYPNRKTEVYDPILRGWSDAGDLAINRSGTLIELPDHTVLDLGVGPVGPQDQWTTTEIWRPGTSSWASGPRVPSTLRSVRPGVAYLPDGRILVVRGRDPNRYFEPAAWYLDPNTLEFTDAPAPPGGSLVMRSFTLPDGRLAFATFDSAIALAPTVLLFDPVTATWSMTSGPEGSWNSGGDNQVIQLTNGQLLSITASGRVIRFDGASNGWSDHSETGLERYGTVFSPLPDGGAIVAAGRTDRCVGRDRYETDWHDTAIRWDPSTGYWGGAPRGGQIAAGGDNPPAPASTTSARTVSPSTALVLSLVAPRSGRFFVPGAGQLDLGIPVTWSFSDLLLHSVVDVSGLDLFDSGPKISGMTFTVTLPASGSYSYRDGTDSSNVGVVKIPPVISPGQGGGPRNVGRRPPARRS